MSGGFKLQEPKSQIAEFRSVTAHALLICFIFCLDDKELKVKKKKAFISIIAMGGKGAASGLPAQCLLTGLAR